MSELTFEKAIEELEGIVKKLEGGKATLDETLELFEKGMELGKYCSEKLDNIEKKIEILVKGSGDVKKEPFEEDK
jgi:exodeoxyribonuclease VII small subunit